MEEAGVFWREGAGAAGLLGGAETAGLECWGEGWPEIWPGGGIEPFGFVDLLSKTNKKTAPESGMVVCARE